MISIGSFIATFVAGLLSFLAPCTVPLLPAYLSCVSGVSAAALNDPNQRGDFRNRLLIGSLLYVLGFTAVFVVAGLGPVAWAQACITPVECSRSSAASPWWGLDYWSRA